MIDTDKYEGHTEGPWNLTPEGHIVADDMTVVCNKHTKRIVETNHKDTQLIADAPLILEELIHYKKLYEYRVERFREDRAEIERLREENERLRDMIEKAVGYGAYDEEYMGDD